MEKSQKKMTQCDGLLKVASILKSGELYDEGFARMRMEAFTPPGLAGEHASYVYGPSMEAEYATGMKLEREVPQKVGKLAEEYSIKETKAISDSITNREINAYFDEMSFEEHKSLSQIIGSLDKGLKKVYEMRFANEKQDSGK